MRGPISDRVLSLMLLLLVETALTFMAWALAPRGSEWFAAGLLTGAAGYTFGHVDRHVLGRWW